MASLFKKTGVKLELLKNIDMLLMVEEGIRGGICHSVHRHAMVNNKYMKDYNKNKGSSYIMYTDNLHGEAISQTLPADGFKRVKDLSVIDEDFIKNYDEDSDMGYIIKADIEYPKGLQSLHSDLPFLPERMNVNEVKR